jgi:hypothetical protein
MRLADVGLVDPVLTPGDPGELRAGPHESGRPTSGR